MTHRSWAPWVAGRKERVAAKLWQGGVVMTDEGAIPMSTPEGRAALQALTGAIRIW